MITINIKTLYGETAKISDIPQYIKRVNKIIGSSNDIILTGQAPIWLYLVIAHAIHGKVKSLKYTSPVIGEITIFDHNPF